MVEERFACVTAGSTAPGVQWPSGRAGDPLSIPNEHGLTWFPNNVVAIKPPVFEGGAVDVTTMVVVVTDVDVETTMLVVECAVDEGAAAGAELHAVSVSTTANAPRIHGAKQRFTDTPNPRTLRRRDRATPGLLPRRSGVQLVHHTQRSRPALRFLPLFRG